MSSPSSGRSSSWTLVDFDFELPPELIAQHPTPERSASRLLDATDAAALADRGFRDLPSLLRPGDLMIFNDTRVIKARLLGRKPTGGAVEALVERVLDPAPDAGHADDVVRSSSGNDDDDDGHRVSFGSRSSIGSTGSAASAGAGTARGRYRVLAHLRTSKPPRPGSVLRFHGPPGRGAEQGFEARVLGRGGADGSLWLLGFPADPYVLLERCGHVPLPPYIAHADDADDERRYQTVFARRPGAVAAPTAALHFDAGVLAELERRGVERAQVTLHVGAGTFQPVRSDDIAGHVMHAERYEVGAGTIAAIAAARARGGRVLAVGTTTLRALESAARAGAFDEDEGAGIGVAGETSIFITPGFDFRVVDLLLTNFHLPRSTLLMLVSAFTGHERMHAIYRHAVAARYRFFSYGDAMLLARQPVERPPSPSR